MACGVCGEDGHNKLTCTNKITDPLPAPPLDHRDILAPSDPTFDYIHPMKVAVYVLLDPESGIPGYVGKTNSPSVRYVGHSGYAHSDELRKWFDVCNRTCLMPPRMKVVAVCSRKDAPGLEARLIHGLKNGGYELANVDHNKRNCQCLFQ